MSCNPRWRRRKRIEEQDRRLKEKREQRAQVTEVMQHAATAMAMGRAR